MPGALTDMWEPERDFAWLKLPQGNVPNLCAISKYVTNLSKNVDQKYQQGIAAEQIRIILLGTDAQMNIWFHASTARHLS
jgi:hypothetical protein